MYIVIAEQSLAAVLQDAALAAGQDPEGDSQSEEIGMADRLDNEMDEGSMDTDDEHDHPDGHGGQYSDDEDEEDEDDEDDDDADDGQVLLAALQDATLYRHHGRCWHLLGIAAMLRAPPICKCCRCSSCLPPQRCCVCCDISARQLVTGSSVCA